MSLDELEQQARAMLDRRTGSYEHAPDLARALLAMLPVVRDAVDYRAHALEERRERLFNAIDAMRSQLGKLGAR